MFHSFTSAACSRLTVSHFVMVICLLTFCVASSSAQIIVPPPPTTVQLPVLGVSVDANGVLQTKTTVDATGELHRRRLLELEHRLPGNIAKPNKLRKISLRKLDAEIAKHRDAGRELPEEILFLAGLQRIQYVFVDIENKDIIIAGPAQGWIDNGVGRKIGWKNRLPVMKLEDLVTALRAFGPQAHLDHWVGCTINPDPNGVKQLEEFNRNSPREIPPHLKREAALQKAKGMRDALGDANIQVFGVSPKTHLGQVLVEADYRMKLMAVGLESPPFKLATFFAGLRGQPRSAFQRWWLVPDYECVRISPDLRSMEMVGQGVKLSTQNMLMGGNNKANKNLGKPHKAATRYAKEFTKHFEKLAGYRPVYAQLRQSIDCLVAAAYLKKTDVFRAIDWSPNALLDDEKLQVENLNAPEKVPCVANSKWERHVLVAIAGGGVSIRASDALKDENLIKGGYEKLDQTRKAVLADVTADNWWWD